MRRPQAQIEQANRLSDLSARSSLDLSSRPVPQLGIHRDQRSQVFDVLEIDARIGSAYLTPASALSASRIGLSGPSEDTYRGRVEVEHLGADVFDPGFGQ